MNTKAKAFSTIGNRSSTESLRECYRQQQEQQAAVSTELLSEKLALLQKNVLAQQEVNQARNNQARLENQVYELDQNLAESRKETQRVLRDKKDRERQLEKSNAIFEAERALWVEREAELVRNLKFATRPLVVQSPTKEEHNSINKESLDVLPPHIQQQIAESTAAQARALRTQEKLVAECRQQIFTLKQDLMEYQQHFSLRESELKAEVDQTRELNERLMKENESYQLLLGEKSMNGEFMQTSIMKSTGYDDDELPGTSRVIGSNGSINLAEELGRAFDQFPLIPPSERSNQSLLAEIETLKDEKTALGLYIAKILTRIMERPGFTSVLAADYSSGRTALPESPIVAIKNSDRNDSSTNLGISKLSHDSSRGSDSETKKAMETVMQPQERALIKQATPNRPRSQSFLQSIFPRSKPVASVTPTSSSAKGSNRSSSEDDSSSIKSTNLASFQEGHVIEDSPRTSHSSADYAVVAQVRPQPPECEQLTTFENPYSRQELRRQSSLSVTARDRHQRRQTIGTTGVSHLKGHGRYVSESNAVPSFQSQGGRRTMAPPALPPMPEMSHHSVSSVVEQPQLQQEQTSPTPEEHERRTASDSESVHTARLSTLSIATSEASSTSTVLTAVATPTTPAVADAGIFRAFKRMSIFGGNTAINNNTNSSSSTVTAVQFPSTAEPDDTRQLMPATVLEGSAAEVA
ncbi:hypothetical protein EDD11_007686 [Mortierella claussenii]|nr:hypothetical protein EDD11_007686 [Mortierella claussenii]